MKEINFKIKISNRLGKVAFHIDKNYKNNTSSTLELIGVLELIKLAHLEQIGEIQRKELLEHGI